MKDITDSFRAAIEQVLPPPKTIIPDGKIHRFSTNGKRDDDSGYYRLYGDGIPAGYFGDFRSDLHQNWCAKSEQKMTAKERAAYRKRIENIQREREEEDERRHAQAATWAADIWKNWTSPARYQVPNSQFPTQGYLKKKQIRPYGIREYAEKLSLGGGAPRKQHCATCNLLKWSGSLAVPLCDIAGKLWSLEFINSSGEKYFLPGGKKRGNFHLIGTIKDVLLVAEGYATGASIHEATGYATAVAFDAGNLLPVAQALRAKHPDIKILMCGDNDYHEDGKENTGLIKATAAASAVNGLLAIPDVIDQKPTDWNDVHVREGLDAVKTAIEAVLDGTTSKTSRQDAPGSTIDDEADAEDGGNQAEEQTPTNPATGTGPFRIKDGRIVRLKMTKEGLIIEPLCNFVATVTEEVAIDDGAETTRAFLIEGRLDTGAHLPPARVPVAKFSSMSWVAEHWGLRAIVRAGMANRDLLREGIQRLSPQATHRHVFTHTGWREINGRYVYLTAGGAIGGGNPAGYEVDLGKELSRYCLPTTPDDAKTAIQASLRLLKLAPLSVTAPLWAGTFRAPLASAHPLDLSLWVEGPTGVLKSTLVAQFLSHYGTFNRTDLTAWSSTANQLERRAFLLKDTVFVIDDWAPTHLDRHELELKASRLIRAQGNLAGRGRLRSDLSERPAYDPRGLIVATGEQHPHMQSILARMLLTELDHGAVNLADLTEAQAHTAVLSHAMSGYLQWLAPQMATLPAMLNETFIGARSRASANGEHLRVPEVLAHLWLGLDTGLRYAEEIGAVSAQEAKELGDECWAVLCQVGQAQGKLVEEERPTRRFLTVLATILTQHKACILPKEDDGDTASKVDLIGWADEDYLYLLPEAAYRAVVTYCRDSSKPFATSSDRLGRDFKIESLSLCDEGRHTMTARVGGSKRRVFKLDRASVEHLVGCEIPIANVPDVLSEGG